MYKFLRYHSPTRSAVAPGSHVLVFDGDCSFCWASVQFIRRHSRVTVVLVPFAELAQTKLLHELDRVQVLASAHYITPEGREYHGGEAMIRAFQQLPGGRLLGVFHLWGLALIREMAYSLVASNRRFFSRLTGPLWGHTGYPACSSHCVKKNQES